MIAPRLGAATTANLIGEVAILLDDEGFFLAPEVLRHPPRNEQQMAEWLGHAGNVLRRAVEHREQIERLTKEHGPDAKVR